MGINNLLPLNNVFISIKWDSTAKVGTIISYKDVKIRFFAEDLQSMIKELQRIEKEINSYAKT